MARLLTALHPHSTPHTPSQLGPAPRFHASFHQPWVQRGRVQEHPAKDMSLGQLKLGGGSRQEAWGAHGSFREEGVPGSQTLTRGAVLT